jgi:AhpD family alkylhydroperoxidase
MKHLIAEAPKVAEAFFNLTHEIRAHCPLTPKERELILVGIFAANKATKGIVTHVERALEAGATKDDIVSAIILALPVAGIPAVNSGLEAALEAINKIILCK